MNRRIFLSVLTTTTLGSAGCLQQSELRAEALICNFTDNTQSGEITITQVEENSVLLSDTFSLDARVRPEDGTTETDPCTEYARSLPPGERIRLSVELDSGVSDSYIWTISESESLQINLRTDGVEFEMLEMPSP